MHALVFDLREIDESKHELVGGKGANLGELARIEGIHVPDAFCVSTDAFRRIIGATPLIGELLDRLSPLRAEDREQIAELSAEIRRIIAGVAIPKDLEEEITRHLAARGERTAYAVRSSATAEDLPTASFAGQQDTYLNVIGKEAVLQHISRCWASLFTERAVIYRLQNGFDHRKVQLAVVVQQMVFPQASGILFTADPVTSNRKVLSIDAGFGLGEALVAGLVNADNYKVRDGRLIDKQIADKRRSVQALPEGGTTEREIEGQRRKAPVLTDEQILELARIGRKIELHFGRPQDIEWCWAEDRFSIVQSRPITTLFPIPEADDTENRVYISVGHQQMMTDPIKPLGISMWQLTVGRPMFKAAGRLFVDVTRQLASPSGRVMLIQGMGQHDPLIKDALIALTERGDFLSPLPPDEQEAGPAKSDKSTPPPAVQAPIENDPGIVADLIQRSETALDALKRDIRDKSGPHLFDFILEDIQQLKQHIADPRSMGVIVAAIQASLWINEKMNEWLGEKNAADTLTQSLPNNVTSEMGLALLDVADVIRPHPEVIAYLEQVKEEDFLEELPKFPGGEESRNAIQAYLDKYGMRCAGEIDISNTRWSEKPTTLLPLILANVKNFEPGAGKRRFDRGRREALQKERELLDRLRQLPDGEEKARETKQKIDLVRNWAGYREYPKYGIVNRYFVYKQALLQEAGRLERAGVISAKEEVYYLTFEELREVVRTHTLDNQLISRRKAEYQHYEKLRPPRVITSEGEIIVGKYKRDHLPAEALVGLAVSSGLVEGRARVIMQLEDATLEAGDILVTVFTDPSWTPLFVSIKGLVTEVGGLMTHGAVIAREYGLPAVVGVENATQLIKDGQRIRVHGTEGYVEIL